jgi:dolichyl-phosphate-mannose-protein mannosyltransferase
MRDRVGRVVAAFPGMGLRGWGIVLGVAAFLVRFPFLFGTHKPFRGGDEEYFLRLAGIIYHQHIFPSHFYTPGYPVMEAVLIPLPGRTEDAVVIGQHLLGVALVVAILVLTWRYFGKAAAILAAAIAALTPVLVQVEHTMSQDFVFGIVVLAAAVAIAEAVRPPEPKLWLLMIAGFLLGVSAYIKPAGQLMIVAPPLALLLARCSLRKVLIGSAIAVVTAFAATFPWQFRNEHLFGHFTMSVQGGLTLFVRVYELDKTPLPTDSADGRFARRIQRETKSYQRLSDAVSLHLQGERNITDDEAIGIERELAITGVRRHPVRYVVKTWPRVRVVVGYLREFHGAGELLDDLKAKKPPWPRAVTAAAWKGARVFATLWWIASLNLLAGLLLLFTGRPEQRRVAAALAAVWISLVCLTALGEGGTAWRYSIEVAPLTFVLGSAGAVLVITSVWRFAAQRRERFARMFGRRSGYPKRS